jgi:nucleoside-diphosphate-sugar epimerase
MRVLIVGCGYVGLPLGGELMKQGHQVRGLCRTDAGVAAMQAAGIPPLQADVTQAAELKKIDGDYDWVVNTVSAGGGGVEEYRRIYLEGTRHLLEFMQARPPRRFVYTSSTGVYAQTDGLPVKEDHPAEANTETNQVLIDTEKLLIEAHARSHFPAVILRVAGIYGPGRCHYLRKFVNNEIRIEGHGERHMNMIHRDDVVGVILAALRNGRPGQTYNAVDDEPVTELHFFRWLSETLGKWMPPRETGEQKTPGQRGWSNKRVLNRKLKMELGYECIYPTFRQGYTAEIRRLEDAGELDIAPEPR